MRIPCILIGVNDELIHKIIAVDTSSTLADVMTLCRARGHQIICYYFMGPAFCTCFFSAKEGEKGSPQE
ncbi:hypothetical protein E2C01_048885 [Portunus trituberculatus]|uniref:Uncharacterized protein n=1 Tax=Portunus trituberculatus TaxID=210409 RepID=A0A5B7GC80_PORTR|nr:hypothetical protein [Portunus trituberculatus]